MARRLVRRGIAKLVQRSARVRYSRYARGEPGEAVAAPRHLIERNFDEEQP